MSKLNLTTQLPALAQTFGWHEFMDADGLAAQLAADVASFLQAGLAEFGMASLIVSGGRSPIMFFDKLSTVDLAWQKVTISLADERWVESGSTDSNEKTVRDHLLVSMAAKAALVPLKTDAPNPESASAERTRTVFMMKRPFDVVMLGMGDDGHTASLFPGAPELANALDPSAEAALVAVSPPTAAHPRLSMNVSALLDARRIIVLIHGATKRAVFDDACANSTSPLSLPIAAILHQSRVPLDVYWSP